MYARRWPMISTASFSGIYPWGGGQVVGRDFGGFVISCYGHFCWFVSFCFIGHCHCHPCWLATKTKADIRPRPKRGRATVWSYVVLIELSYSVYHPPNMGIIFPSFWIVRFTAHHHLAPNCWPKQGTGISTTDFPFPFHYRAFSELRNIASSQNQAPSTLSFRPKVLLAKAAPFTSTPIKYIKTRHLRSNRLTAPARLCRNVGFRRDAGEGNRREYGRGCESLGTVQEQVERASVPRACAARVFGDGCDDDARRSGFSPWVG